MSAKNNGGPAFPTDSAAQIGDQRWSFEGMTLRDYFAAKAMQGAIAGVAAHKGDLPYRELAGLAYEVADAMLAERDK